MQLFQGAYVGFSERLVTTVTFQRLIVTDRDANKFNTCPDPFGIKHVQGQNISQDTAFDVFVARDTDYISFFMLAIKQAELPRTGARKG